MRFIIRQTVLLIFVVQMMSGCGGGGGGGGGSSAPPTQTVAIKLSSQSLNPSDVISGFDLDVTLPSGAGLAVDGAAVPVFLSGQFVVGQQSQVPVLYVYDSSTRVLKVAYASADQNKIGEFLTIRAVVPTSYVFNASDFTPLVFKAFDLNGGQIPGITVTAGL